MSSLKNLVYHWILQFCDPFQLLFALPRFIWYFRQLIRYRRIKDAEPIRLIDTYPCLHDRTKSQFLGGHYFHQNIWAFQRILSSGIKYHTDVGALVDFVGYLTLITYVVYIDIRPLKSHLEKLDSIQGSILSLPLKNNSVSSLSCLHVAEHIGLGRYGDPLAPDGTIMVCKELSRVLAKDGLLYFSLPIGRSRLCFNAHRIHSPQQIIEYFNGLRLLEFSLVDDEGKFHEDVSPDLAQDLHYACGLFLFTKK